MTTNKPEVKRYDYGYTDDGYGGGRYLGLILRHDGKLVRYEDYEALQAECEKLRKDADRIDWLADPSNSIGNVQLPMAIVHQHLHSLRDAIDAATNGERP